ncbi:ATP-binding protein [Streptomyces sp. NPDC006992]|uniref:ATP-binding protein n=1 Tax=unclassified Streptomyces TaxID=2593676 RepID=UPI00340B9414
MELATTPPAARLPAAWYVWWALPVAICVATAVAMVAGSAGAQPAVLIAGAVATAATAVCVERLLNCERRFRHAVGSHRDQAMRDKEQWERWLASVEEKYTTELSALQVRLTDVTERHRVQLLRLPQEFLPAAIDALRQGEAMDDLLRPLAEDPEVPEEFRGTFRKILRSAMIAIEEEFDRSTSARQSVVSIGSRMQVYTSKIRAQLHEMQGVHGNLPTVARDLMQLDQEIGPADCLAASIVVLGGADRPGRQWQTHQPLISVARGGMARIKEYKRVQLRSLPELGVDGSLVDHLTLILAHLMDNATRYSPPAETVIVSGREVPNGLGIEIQDAGTGLKEEKRRQALRLLDGVAVGSGPGGLAEDAQLGLRVVGNLARKYGITVTFDHSPWLGTAVVVVVPHKYFKPLDQPRYPDPSSVRAAIPRRRPDPVPVSPPADEAPEEEPLPGGTTPGGLPKRSKQSADGPGVRHGMRAPAGEDPGVPPEESFAGLAAFVSGSGPGSATDRHDRLDDQQEGD